LTKVATVTHAVTSSGAAARSASTAAADTAQRLVSGSRYRATAASASASASTIVGSADTM